MNRQANHSIVGRRISGVNEPLTVHVKAAEKKRKRTGLSKYLYLLPAALLIVGVIGYPIVRALILSLYAYNPLSSGKTFVGLKNYVGVLSDSTFLKAMSNTAIWVIGCVFFQVVFGLLGAVLLNQNFRGRGVIRGLTLIPWATPSVLAAMMWMWILDGNYGLLNDILMRIGLIVHPIPWISQTGTAMASLMLIDVWQGIPYFAVMLLAAMQTIPGDLLEAAKLDGAGAWKAFWKVVFPLMLPTLMITTILRIVWTASYMDLMMVVTQGGPAYSTLTIPLASYYRAYTDLKYGEATAMAGIQALLLLIVVVLYLRLMSNKGALDNGK
ncbi:carbohydrate ABC transporter permease [Cohnella laeviribosi]